MKSDSDKFYFSRLHTYLAILAVLVGCYARIRFMPVISLDWSYFLEKWMRTLNERGFSAIGTDFSDYNYIYLYMLWIAAQLPIFAFYSIKLLSICFDIAMMAATFALLKIERVRQRAAYGAAAVFLCPTCIINSSGWGQCDAIYVFFLILSLYFLLKRWGLGAMACFAMAFCFKLQSVFILPAYAVIFLNRDLREYYRLKFRYLLLPQLFFAFFAFPTLFSGNSPANVFLLGPYIHQAKDYASRLTWNAPTIYAFIDENSPCFDALNACATFLSLLAIGIGTICFAAYYKSHKNNFIGHILLITQFMSASSIFLLPRMHERYFFFCDILSIIIFCRDYRPILFIASVCIICASLISYNFYFPFMPELFSIKLAATLMFCGIALTGIALATDKPSIQCSNTI